MQPKTLKSLGIGVLNGFIFAVIILICAYNVYWYYVADTLRKNSIETVNTLAGHGVIFNAYPQVKGYPFLPYVTYSGDIRTAAGTVNIPSLRLNILLPLRYFEIILPEGFAVNEPWLQTAIQFDTLYAKGKLPDSFPSDLSSRAIMQWREKSRDALEIRSLNIQKDVFSFQATGYFTLDANLQPAGILKTKTSGHQSFIRNIRRQGLLPDPLGSIIQVSLASLSTQDNVTGLSNLVLPVRIEYNSIFLGSLKVGNFKPVAWDIFASAPGGGDF